MLRQKLAFYLEDLSTPQGKIIQVAIALLVLLSSGIFVAETYAIPDSYSHALNIVDDVILGAFVIEYFLRLWCAENRIAYFFNLYALIDLIVILPFFFGAVDVAFLRLLRWFRFLRLARFIGNTDAIGRIINNEGAAIFLRILFTLSAIVFIFSGLIYQVEHSVNPEAFATFLDAFYFSIFTMTTVGFSNVMPATEAGRLMSVLMVLTGIALIPVQLGELIKRLVKTEDQVDITCPSCGWETHDSDARFCKICGASLAEEWQKYIVCKE